MKISEYTGYNAVNKIKEQDRRQSYLINWEHLYLNYGDNVEFQRLERQIILCPETEDYLYPDNPPSCVKYKRGARPVLDGIVNDICEDASTDREKVLAIMCFCRDLYKKFDNEQLFYGGTEEELIKKGERLCECLARLAVALCEVAGIPGRIVLFVCGGHLTSELYLEDKWCWIDPRIGIFALNEQGNMASVKELYSYREMILKQSNEVKAYISPLWNNENILQRYYHVYFHPREIIAFGEYSLTDSEKFNFEWKSIKQTEQDGLPKLNKEYKENRFIVFELDKLKNKEILS